MQEIIIIINQSLYYLLCMHSLDSNSCNAGGFQSTISIREIIFLYFLPELKGI